MLCLHHLHPLLSHSRPELQETSKARWLGGSRSISAWSRPTTLSNTAGRGGTRAPPSSLRLGARTEPLTPTRSWPAWLTRLEHDLRVTSVPLNPLLLEDVVQLVQALAGARAKTGEGATAHLERFGRWL